MGNWRTSVRSRRQSESEIRRDLKGTGVRHCSRTWEERTDTCFLAQHKFLSNPDPTSIRLYSVIFGVAAGPNIRLLGDAFVSVYPTIKFVEVFETDLL